MKISNFLEELEEIHNKENDYHPNISTMLESVSDTLNKYQEIIPIFFYDKENVNCIQGMYRSLNKEMYENCDIPCLNLEKSEKIYKEYHDGMLTFIGDITRSYISESVSDKQKETFEIQLGRAKDMDHTFISSIFGGENNQKENVLLTEAAKNIEFLVEFMPEIEKMKEECKTIVENVNDDSDELVKDSIRLMYESVEEYCHRCIYESVITLDTIMKKIENPFPKEEKKEFVLF